MARSTLELLLDSIKDKEEQPAEELPWLPKRPTSRARLPSSRVRPSLLFGEYKLNRSTGNISRQTSSTTDNFHSKERDEPTVSLASVCFLHEKDNSHTNEMNEPSVNRNHVASVLSPSKSDKSHSNNAVNQKHVEEGKLEKIDMSKDRLNTGGTDEEFVLQAMNSIKKQEQSVGLDSMKKRKRDYHHTWRKGSRVWFLNQESKWTQGVIQSTDDLDSTVSLVDGQVVRVQSDRLLPANPNALDDVNDLVQLSYINEPSILHTLQRRYEMGKIYTRAGSMMIACASSMGQQSADENALETLKLPHQGILAVVENALKAMKRDEMNQSIIFSGENDVGKLKTMKSALRYLVSCGGNHVLGKLLLAVQPIVEAFTCAKPSSCVGEMVNLYYNNSGSLTGAEWKTVPFEKSRVLPRDEGEWSYDIFYQLCEGADSIRREKLGLMGVREFNYLNKSELNFVDGTNYQNQFQSVIDSLCAFGINKQDQDQIFTLLAAILWLGNVTIPALDNGSQALGNAARLLQCSREQLLEALCNIECDPIRVTAAKDLLAQLIYEGLFQWLMAQINRVLKSEMAGENKYITIVNMPGFGLSKRKGLDGLLVNYSYEYLQQFTKNYLSQLEEEDIIYRQHRIGSARNAVTEFLEQVLFPFLEDVPKGDSTQKLESLIANSSCCKQKSSHEYSIFHIFEEVTYDGNSILEGTHNFVGPQLLQILNSCLSRLYLSEKSNPYDLYSELTLSSRCQEWVQQMMWQLHNSSPRFILCVVPSKFLSTNSFEERFVLQQLRLNRVTEAVKALRTGCIEQIAHQFFASRYGILLAPSDATGRDVLGICIEVLQRLNIPPYMYRVGLRNMFFHPEQIDKLEETRKTFLDGIVAVQKTYRGYKVRLSFKKQKRALTFLQAVIRGWLVRKSFAHQSVKVHMDMSIIRKEEVDGGFITKPQLIENGEVKYANKIYDGNKESDNKSTRGQDWQGVQDKIWAALQRKEEENAVLHQTIKEYERKWTLYEAKMKSMEEMWTKQITTLQQNLCATPKGLVVEQPLVLEKKYNERDGGSLHYSEGNTPDITPRSESNTSRSEFDPSRSVINQLSKELERRTQIFNDDVGFLVEVKSGQVEANFKPNEELQKVTQKFEVWKKDFKGRLKETKNILKKLGKSDSTETKRKKWWGGK